MPAAEIGDGAVLDGDGVAVGVAVDAGQGDRGGVGLVVGRVTGLDLDVVGEHVVHRGAVGRHDGGRGRAAAAGAVAGDGRAAPREEDGGQGAGHGLAEGGESRMGCGLSVGGAAVSGSWHRCCDAPPVDAVG